MRIGHGILARRTHVKVGVVLTRAEVAPAKGGKSSLKDTIIESFTTVELSPIHLMKYTRHQKTRPAKQLIMTDLSSWQMSSFPSVYLRPGCNLCFRIKLNPKVIRCGTISKSVKMVRFALLAYDSAFQKQTCTPNESLSGLWAGKKELA